MAKDSLTIPNRHAPECGPLPQWALDPPEASYLGYYENQYGEQWLFMASAASARLAGGDCGWESIFELLRPPWDEIRQGRFPDWPALHLIPQERSWLEACLAAAAMRFSSPPSLEERR